MVAVLCYHKVGSQEQEGRWINVSPQTLSAHIEFFKRRNYAVVPPIDLAKTLPKRAICLTFDDAYVSTVENGLPILLHHQVPATFYAVTKYIGGPSAWVAPDAAPLADWPELKRAAEHGIEIGNHTHSHLRLSELDRDGQRAEIEKCTWILRERGFEPQTFCLPFGAYNQESAAAIADAGFPVGFTVEKRWVRESDDRRLLPRFAMSYGDAVPQMLYKLFIRPRMKLGR